MTAYYRPDHKSFGEYLLSKSIRDVSEEAAQDVLEAAVRIATPHAKTSNYVRGFKLNKGGVMTIGFPPNPRCVTEVENDDPASVPNEFGNRNIKARHTLARAGAEVLELRGVLPDD